MPDPPLPRRGILRYAVSVSGGGVLSAAAKDKPPSATKLKAKSVAAVITEYRPGSHADVLIGEILEGGEQDRGPRPALKLASMYVEQFPPQDLAGKVAGKDP